MKICAEPLATPALISQNLRVKRFEVNTKITWNTDYKFSLFLVIYDTWSSNFVGQA